MNAFVSRRCIAAVLVSAVFLHAAIAQSVTRSERASEDANGQPFAAVTEKLTTSYKSIRAVVVSRADLPIFEYYRGRIDPDEPVDVHSVTKTVTSILVGIAFGQGKLQSLEQPISEFLPEVHAPGVDPRARDITIKHLLTMTSGFEPASPSHIMNGKWNGQQIVPEWFVRDSITPHQSLDDYDYGYLWWIPKPLRHPGPYAAVGYGGQMIFVVPLLDVVIAIQSDSNGSMDDARNLVGMILQIVRGLAP